MNLSISRNLAETGLVSSLALNSGLRIKKESAFVTTRRALLNIRSSEELKPKILDPFYFSYRNFSQQGCLKWQNYPFLKRITKFTFTPQLIWTMCSLNPFHFSTTLYKSTTFHFVQDGPTNF